jgi:hypothetical protein
MREKGLFWGSKIPRKTGREPARLPAPRLRRRLSSHEGFPTPKISLIREKTAPRFSDILGSKPIWLSGAFSQRKITAKSTYREAKLHFYGLLVAETKKRVCKIMEKPGRSPTALYPVEYDNLTSDPVLPDSDTIIILKPSQLVDIEITKNIF